MGGKEEERDQREGGERSDRDREESRGRGKGRGGEWPKDERR